MTDRNIQRAPSARPSATPTLSADIAVPLAYAAAGVWCIAAAFLHDSAWPVAAGFAMIFGFLGNLSLPITSARRSVVDEPARVAISGMLIILGSPFVLVLFALSGLRGGAPLGLRWGIAAAAGAALGAAIACSVDVKRLGR